ncbi:hypothetical protein MKX01_038853 [Papaver californicum]|nr:hypothetical protein MKX01_038853 [Papaver californicum]
MASSYESYNFKLKPKVIDSHLHVWASPEEEAEKYPYFPGQKPTLPGDADFLLKSMGEAGVHGALIGNFLAKIHCGIDNTVLKKYQSKFVGCCLANPAEDGSGIKQLEDLILKMTNEVGRALFSKAGELGVPVGFMCMKGLNLHIAEIKELCTDFPSTTVILDHSLSASHPCEPLCYFSFCTTEPMMRQNAYIDPGWRTVIFFFLSETRRFFLHFLSCQSFPSDFPFVVPECGYIGAKEAVSLNANQIKLSSSDLEWIMGRTVVQLLQGSWTAS